GIFELPMTQSEDGDFRLLRQVAEMIPFYRIKVERAGLWMPNGMLQDIKKADKHIKDIFK
ncbi:MAG: hypothetical protein ACQEP6_01345, partial [Patescibacteria group bacterium]